MYTACYTVPSLKASFKNPDGPAGPGICRTYTGVKIMKRFAIDAHKAHMINRLNSSATCLAPFKVKRVRIPASASWLISEIKRLMKERDPRIKGIAVSTKDQTKWMKYKKIKNQVNYSIIVCKKDYYHSYFESNIGKIKATCGVAKGGS